MTNDMTNLELKFSRHTFCEALNVRNVRAVSMTGTMSMKRDDFRKMLVKVGLPYSELPSRRYDLLITGKERVTRSTKRAAAESCGACVVTEAEFVRAFKAGLQK